MYFHFVIVPVIMLSVLLSRCSSYKSHVNIKCLMRNSAAFLHNPVVPTSMAGRRFLSIGVDGFEKRTKDRKKIADDARMDERIHNAENWVTMKLSDKEAADFNKALGIEDEVMEALAESERKGERESKKAQNALLKLKGVGERQFQEGRVKGFLEQNPFLCPGCGAPFQARSPDTPGNIQAPQYFLTVFPCIIISLIILHQHLP